MTEPRPAMSAAEYRDLIARLRTNTPPGAPISEPMPAWLVCPTCAQPIAAKETT